MERTGGVGGAENHSTALDALDFAGFEVDNHQYLATNDFFGLVMLCNARNYRALVDAGINGEFQEFVGLGFSAARMVAVRMSHLLKSSKVTIGFCSAGLKFCFWFSCLVRLSLST